MRYIDKTNVDKTLCDRLHNHELVGGKFCNLPRTSKKDLSDSLITEQGGLCCYCEDRLIKGNLNNHHIEHIKPQCLCPQLSLDYSNMACSCQRNLKDDQVKHCGMAKGNKMIKITPLDPNCSSHFKFTDDGRILPADPNDKDAETTIDILKLQHPLLVQQRKKVIEKFNDDFAECLKNNRYTEIIDALNKYCNGSSAKEPHPFISAVRYCFKKIIY